MTKRRVGLTVNGCGHSIEIAEHRSLLDVLREELGLTGTKKGCNAGDCGACTVLLDGEPVNACLVLGVQAEGREVRTIEGIGDGDRLHPLQEAFVKHGAVQCGFCTPGVVMSAYALLQETPRPSREQIAGALSGNLCRCTGYYQIVDAISAAAFGEQ